MTDYQWLPGMGEISGFGGDYEQTCRDMLLAGLKWWDEHPSANPTFSEMENVYGIIHEENDDAKQLSQAVVSGCDDCTGAMHQAVIEHIMAIRANGWEWYVQAMSEPDNPDDLIDTGVQ